MDQQFNIFQSNNNKKKNWKNKLFFLQTSKSVVKSENAFFCYVEWIRPKIQCVRPWARTTHTSNKFWENRLASVCIIQLANTYTHHTNKMADVWVWSHFGLSGPLRDVPLSASCINDMFVLSSALAADTWCLLGMGTGSRSYDPLDSQASMGRNSRNDTYVELNSRVPPQPSSTSLRYHLPEIKHPEDKQIF